MASYGTNLYIHGGGGEFNDSTKLRISLNDTWKYSTTDNMWTQVRYKPEKVKKILTRVHAASGIMEHIWVIHGGCNGSRQHIYQDLSGFNFMTEKFVKIYYSNNKRAVPGLVGHSMVTIMPDYMTKRDENKDYWTNFHKWRFTAEDVLSSSKVGAYIIGGVDVEGEFNEDVWFIKCNSQKAQSTMKKKGDKIKFNYTVDCEILRTTGIDRKSVV